MGHRGYGSDKFAAGRTDSEQVLLCGQLRINYDAREPTTVDYSPTKMFTRDLGLPAGWLLACIAPFAVQFVRLTPESEACRGRHPSARSSPLLSPFPAPHDLEVKGCFRAVRGRCLLGGGFFPPQTGLGSIVIGL